ncbi:MAG: M23 family metallopeptidase [Lysobacterales bacterium]
MVLAVFSGLSLAADGDPRLSLPASVPQGGLVLGRAPPDTEIHYAGRRLRIAEDGSFVFGIGRDDTGPAALQARFADGTMVRPTLAIVPRLWAIERVDGVPETTVNPPPEIARRIASEQAEVARARERDDGRSDYRFGFRWPAQGRISGVYGSQRILNGTPKNPHYGTDIAVATGTPIQAPAAGIVSFADSDLYLTGGTVLIDHGHGLSSSFLHMSRIEVKLGDRVEQGQVVGRVGQTGRASGPHLHWGLNWFDVRIDPQLLVAPMQQ